MCGSPALPSSALLYWLAILLAGVVSTAWASGPKKSVVKDPAGNKSVVSHLARLQNGVATWYGKQFHGHHTASGEKFNMYGLTAAHRTLPLGTWLRVTNTTNQKSVLVRVNDRGPMSSKYVLDLSYGAAQAIGIAGYAKVQIDQLEKNDPEVLLASAPRPILLPGALSLEPRAANADGLPVLDAAIASR